MDNTGFSQDAVVGSLYWEVDGRSAGWRAGWCLAVRLSGCQAPPSAPLWPPSAPLTRYLLSGLYIVHEVPFVRLGTYVLYGIPITQELRIGTYFDHGS